MNNRRFRPTIWRLRLQFRFARLQAAWHRLTGDWQVPAFFTNRWFMLGAYFLVVLLVGLAWFGQPALRLGAPLPGEQPGFPTGFFGWPSDDIAPPFNQPPLVEPAELAPTSLASVAPEAGPPAEAGASPTEAEASSTEAKAPPTEPDQTSEEAQPATESMQPPPGQTPQPPPSPTAPQNEAMAAALGNPPPLCYPIAGDISITNPYALIARQGTLNDWRAHQAVDIAAAIGSPVRAAAKGKVKQIVERDQLWGTVVVLDHGSGYTTSYSSLQDLSVRVGQAVAAGQTIGKLSGSPPAEQMAMSHLHFQLCLSGQPLDPLELFREDN